jgi:hypothetical protein
MKIPIVKFAFVLILSVLLTQTTNSQEESPPEWSPKLNKFHNYKSSFVVGLSSLEDMRKMETLWNEIGEDLKIEQNDFAGTYVNLGYESGYFLRWTLNKGFILIPYFDQNYIQDFSYGKVTFVDSSEIIFTPERELSFGRPFKKLPRKWTVIGSGFNPVEMLKDLGLYRAGLGMYNDFNGECCIFAPEFVNRKVEEKLTPNPIPDKYKHFFINPISGQITFVGKKRIVKKWGYDGQLYSQSLGKTALVPVKVNVGRKHHVKKNMLFRLIDGLEYDKIQYLQIMKVGKTSSEGFVVREFSYEGKEVYHDYTDDKDKPFPPVKVGTKISTSP